MRILSALLLACVVAAGTPSRALAASPHSIPLQFRTFPDYEQEAPPPNGMKLMKRHHRAARQDTANRSPATDKVHQMMVDHFGEEPDGFIQLSDNEFIVFISDTGRVVMGLYLVDLGTNTISDAPLAHGAVSIKSVLKDKSGNNYLLLHHFYPMHAGVSGESYSFLSARRSEDGKAIVTVTGIGEAEEYDDDSDECARDAKAIVHRSIAVSVNDLNHDGQPDVAVTQTLFSCATRRVSTQVTDYFATPAGFSAATGDLARRLSVAGKKESPGSLRKGNGILKK